MKIVNYYHIWCSSPRTKDIVDEYIQALTTSGMAVDLRLGLIGLVWDREKVKQWFDASGIPYSVIAEADEGFEQVTLDVMRTQAVINQDEYYILYTHTKGTLHDHDLARTWRKQMTWWNVTNWQEAYGHLESGASAVGIHLMRGYPIQPRIFGGNFWWSRASVIRQLPQCSTASRHEAELWLGRIEDINPNAVLIDMCPTTIGDAHPRY